MQFASRQRKKAVINIISLVDVVFLLLIFFTVSANFMNQPALKIDLPEAEAGPKESEATRSLIVYITSQGELFLGDQAINIADLPDIIKTSLEEGNPPSMVIKADKEVIHGRVIEVMDIARRNGIEAVTVGTQSKVKGSKNP